MIHLYLLSSIQNSSQFSTVVKLTNKSLGASGGLLNLSLQQQEQLQQQHGPVAEEGLTFKTINSARLLLGMTKFLKKAFE
jgi:hypothetical protein